LKTSRKGKYFWKDSAKFCIIEKGSFTTPIRLLFLFSQYYDSETDDYENFEAQRLSSGSRQLSSDLEPQRSSSELEDGGSDAQKSINQPSSEYDQKSLIAEERRYGENCISVTT
jgi:hypothetical protein